MDEIWPIAVVENKVRSNPCDNLILNIRFKYPAADKLGLLIDIFLVVFLIIFVRIFFIVS
jgi:hypothetical protein